MTKFVKLKPDETFDKTKFIELNFKEYLLKLVKLNALSVDIYKVVRLVGYL